MSTRWYANPAAREFVAAPEPRGVLDFHRSLPGYAPTALLERPDLARELGVGRVFVKQESSRFGLPAFKLLGASWAVFRALSARAGRTEGGWQPDTLARRFAGDPDAPVLVSATDGNHGRAVARMAARMGLAARIFVPEEISPRAKEAVSGEGAELTALALPYDDVVRAAADAAQADPRSILVQDTAWEGYTTVPGWIVEGYSTLFAEIDTQLQDAGAGRPSMVVTPVGVGSLLQATVRHYRKLGGSRPALLSVEPESAPCLLRSLEQGERTSVPTGHTMMAGLNCGTVSLTAWPELSRGVDAAVVIGEEDCRRAVKDLEELGVDSGPCGAASLAGARAVLEDPNRRAGVGAAADDVVVLLSTEGRAATPVEPPYSG